MTKCFILEWKIRFALTLVAPILSQKTFGVFASWTFSSLNKLDNHMTSAEPLAKARYSASVEDRAMNLCLKDFYEMGFCPRYAMKPEVDE